jgi:hypothetical protein
VKKIIGPEHGLAAELLSQWRSAERDTVAAQNAESVAALAVDAATTAEAAAVRAEEAATAAMEAAVGAQAAAELARKAAAQAADGALMAGARAEGDEARAGQVLATAQRAEEKARDRFHEAEDKGFKIDSPETGRT